MGTNILKMSLNITGLNEFEKFINVLIEEFTERISVKTGWGKNEIMSVFKDSIIAATAKSVTLIRTDKPTTTDQSEPTIS